MTREINMRKLYVSFRDFYCYIVSGSPSRRSPCCSATFLQQWRTNPSTSSKRQRPHGSYGRCSSPAPGICNPTTRWWQILYLNGKISINSVVYSRFRDTGRFSSWTGSINITQLIQWARPAVTCQTGQLPVTVWVSVINWMKQALKNNFCLSSHLSITQRVE